MKTVWVYLLFWIEQRSKALYIFGSVCGKNYKGGRRKYFLRQAECVFFVRILRKYFIPWVASNSPRGWLRILKSWFASFGGVTTVILGRFPGWSGNDCVNPRRMEHRFPGDWSPIKLCWLKQVWRMINNPDSLCYKVFKARFFPNCSILEGNDSKASSYA